MGLFDYVADLRAARLVDELSQQLARNTGGPLREVCETRVPGMSHAEARGYVWAKSRPIVAIQVAKAALIYPTLTESSLTTLGDRTQDLVVRTVLGDLTRDRVRHAGRRRAA